MTQRFTTTHRCAATTLPNTKTNKKHFLLTFALWGVWDSPTVKRKCFTLFLYEVKLSQHVGGSQWLKGHNDPKITHWISIHLECNHWKCFWGWFYITASLPIKCFLRGKQWPTQWRDTWTQYDFPKKGCARTYHTQTKHPSDPLQHTSDHPMNWPCGQNTNVVKCLCEIQPGELAIDGESMPSVC